MVTEPEVVVENSVGLEGVPAPGGVRRPPSSASAQTSAPSASESLASLPLTDLSLRSAAVPESGEEELRVDASDSFIAEARRAARSSFVRDSFGRRWSGRALRADFTVSIVEVGRSGGLLLKSALPREGKGAEEEVGQREEGGEGDEGEIFWDVFLAESGQVCFVALCFANLNSSIAPHIISTCLADALTATASPTLESTERFFVSPAEARRAAGDDEVEEEARSFRGGEVKILLKILLLSTGGGAPGAPGAPGAAETT